MKLRNTYNTIYNIVPVSTGLGSAIIQDWRTLSFDLQGARFMFVPPHWPPMIETGLESGLFTVDMIEGRALRIESTSLESNV
jgi:hypothetical protein